MAITDAWTAIATTQTDKDSPQNETLFNALRGNGYHNYDWIGKDYTPADNHDHDGVNSKHIVNNTLTSEVSTTSTTGATLSPTTTTMAFWPQIKTANGGATAYLFPDGNCTTTSTSYVNRVRMQGTNNFTAYALFTYIAASPPHRFAGAEDFGHFLFLHRRKSDGKILSSSCAPDPVWHGPWSPLPKHHPARIAMRPHPFADFEDAPLPASEEIVLVDLRHLQEVTTHRPRATAYAALCAKRQEFVALGIGESEIAQYEAVAAAEMAAEAEEQTAAARKIDELDGSMPRLIAQAPETRPTLKGVVDVRADYFAPTKTQLQSFWAARKRILRRQAGHVTKIEKIQAEAEARGSSLLQEINEGRVPDAIATKELPKNDRDKLPNVPAFRDRVRALRA